MIRLLTQLDTLADIDPSMKNAVENIKRDCETDEQPYGNIKKKVLESICCRCGSCGDDEIDHLKEVFEEHRSIKKPDHFEKINPPADQPLLRVISLNSFVQYHMVGKNYNDKTLVAIKKKSILDRFKSESISLRHEELQGSTGRENDPSWWTFNEPHLMTPESGENYMKELALSNEEISRAKDDNMVLEISIESKYLDSDFFKPTALDSFMADTKFMPETTGQKYGYTAPLEPGLKPRPEIVSPSKSYRELDELEAVSIKKYDFIGSKL